MLTKRQAMYHGEYHRGICTVTDNVLCSDVWTRTGKTQTWVRRPTDYYLRVRQGKEVQEIRPCNADNWHSGTNCPCRVVSTVFFANGRNRDRGVCRFALRVVPITVDSNSRINSRYWVTLKVGEPGGYSVNDWKHSRVLRDIAGYQMGSSVWSKFCGEDGNRPGDDRAVISDVLGFILNSDSEDIAELSQIVEKYYPEYLDLE